MTAMTICIGDVMDLQHPQNPCGEALPEFILPTQPLANHMVAGSKHEQPDQGPDEWGERLRSLEQWICELLIKNQQLRMALESAMAPENEEQDG